MEQCSPLGWVYYTEEEGISELKRFLVQTTIELEATILAARDEISRKDEELAQMRDLLMAAVKERDGSQYKCQELLLEKLSLQQQLQQLQKAVSFSKIITNNEDNKPRAVAARGSGDTNTNTTSFSSSDSEESIISEPLNTQLPTPSSSILSSSVPPKLAATLGKQRPLPEKGKLLQAVMEAGPILQTLLLAGPLPQWHHPPPQLDTIEIPPVTIPSSPVQPKLLMHQDSIVNNACLVNANTNTNNKRGLDRFDGSVSSPNRPKYQRVV